MGCQASSITFNRHLAIWTVMALLARTLYLLQFNKEPEIEPSDEVQIKADDSMVQPEERVKRPRFILHVGPPKAASTTIQQDLRERKSLILEDNYLNLGKWRGNYPDNTWPLLRNCPAKLDEALAAGQEADDVECYQDFLSHLVKHKGRSIIISDEMFAGADSGGDNHWFQHRPTMRRYFLDVIEEERDILVVAVYRRYAEWLVSSKKQTDARQCLGDRFKPLPTDWPQHGGRACEANWPAIVANTQNFTQFETGFRYETPKVILRPWMELGVETLLMNMHEERPVTERLVCDVLDDMSLTCASLQAESETRHANQRTTDRFAYDWIVVKAAEKGLVDLKHPRLDVVDELIAYHQGMNMTFHDLPLVCPSRHEVQPFLDVSLAMETELMPQSAADSESDHREGFWKMYDRGDFCTPNESVLLENASSWEDLLKSMAQSFAGRRLRQAIVRVQ